MSRPRVRAVVLAAGLGTRLRPLTTELPKGLLPILGRPLLAESLDRLAASGVEATAINLHHRGEAIASALGDRFAGMPLHYSREETLLGTLGALHPLRDFLAPADLVLLVNGDSLCRWPFAELLDQHRDRRPLATLLFSAAADFSAFGGGAIDEHGRLVSFPVASGSPRAGSCPHGARDVLRVFAGAHVFAPSLALEAPAVLSDIVRDLYAPRLAAGDRLECLVSDAPWHDLGTPSRYLDAVLDWLDLAAGRGDAAGSWSATSARVAATATLERVAIEAGAVVGAEVRGRDVLVLSGARVGEGSRLERVVVGPGVEISGSSSLRNVLVTPQAWGEAAGSRREGSLVFTPLEPSARSGAGAAPHAAARPGRWPALDRERP